MLRQIIRGARARVVATRSTASLRCRFSTTTAPIESNRSFPPFVLDNLTDNTHPNAASQFDDTAQTPVLEQLLKLRKKRDFDSAEALFQTTKENQPHEITIHVCEAIMQIYHKHKDITKASKLILQVLSESLGEVRVGSRRLLGLYLNLAAEYPAHLKVATQVLKHASEHKIDLEHFHYWTIAAALIRASRFDEACEILVLGKNTLDLRGVPMSTYETDTFFRHSTLMMSLLHSDSQTFQQHLDSLVAEDALDQSVLLQWLDALAGPGRGNFQLQTKLIESIVNSKLSLNSGAFHRVFNAACDTGDSQLADRVWALLSEKEQAVHLEQRYMQMFIVGDIQGYLRTAKQDTETDTFYRLSSAAILAARRYDFESTAKVLSLLCQDGVKPTEACISQILCLASSAGVTKEGVRTLVKCLKELQIEIPDTAWHRTFQMCSSGNTPDILEEFYESYLKLVSEGTLKVTSEALTTATVAFGRVVSAEKAEAVFSKLVFDHGAEPSLQLFRLLYGAYDQLLSRSEHLHFYYIVQAAFPEPDQPATSTTSDKMLISKMLEIMRTARQRAEDMVGKTRKTLFWSSVGRFDIPVFDDAPTEYFVKELTKGRVGREPKQADEASVTESDADQPLPKE